MDKERINVYLTKECLDILQQAKKLNNIKINRSELIEHAVKQLYQNEKEALRNEAKEYQKRIMEIKDKIKNLEE